MKTNTEVGQLTQLLRDENYPTLLKRLIEKIYRVEVCEHLCVQPCRQCLADVDSPILERWEDL